MATPLFWLRLVGGLLLLVVTRSGPSWVVGLACVVGAAVVLRLAGVIRFPATFGFVGMVRSAVPLGLSLSDVTLLFPVLAVGFYRLEVDLTGLTTTIGA